MRARAALAIALAPALAVLLVGLGGCGGSPPTVAPIVRGAPVVDAAAVALPDPAPDVSAVPAPVGLGFTVHLAHPRTTLLQITSLLGSLAAFVTGSAKPDPESLVALAIGAPVGPLVDLDQPIDLVVADVNGSPPKVAAAAALIDPVAARETLEKYFTWTQTSPAVVRLEPRDDAAEDATPRPCMLAPSFGSTPGATRLVCGDSQDTLRHLGPYLTRTMTRLASSDDLRVELFVHELRPPRSGVAQELTAGGGVPVDAGPGDSTDEWVSELTDKLTDDVGSVVLEASADTSTVDVRLTTGFIAAASSLTRALVGAGVSSSSVPAAFERLPSGSSFAWYGRGASAADIAPLRKVLLGGLRRFLEDDGYVASACDAQLAPLERLFMTGGPWVVATGLDLDAARTALDAYASAGKTAESARAKARGAVQGWAVAGVEEPAQGWIDGIRELVKNDGVPPTGKPRRKREPSKERTKLALAPVPPALKLPAGTLQVEARETQNPAWSLARRKAKTPVADPVIPHTLHFFVVPDGARTWFAAAEDPLVAAREVRASLSGPGEAGTLKTRRDLDGLRGMAASTAGFVSVAGLATWFLSDWSDEGLRKARQSLAGLASLSHGGETPVPFALVATPGADGAAAGGNVRLRVLLSIPLAVEIAASRRAIF